MVFIFILSKITEYSNKAPRMSLVVLLLHLDPIFTKDKEYAGNHPGLESIQSISFRRICGDGIEDIDENQKESD